MSAFGELVPLVLWLVALGGLIALVGIGRDLLLRTGIATVGSAFVAYGLRDMLRTWGGGYYCCNHAIHATVGLTIAALGWVGLLVAIRGPILEDA